MDSRLSGTRQPTGWCRELARPEVEVWDAPHALLCRADLSGRDGSATIHSGLLQRRPLWKNDRAETWRRGHTERGAVREADAARPALQPELLPTPGSPRLGPTASPPA